MAAFHFVIRRLADVVQQAAAPCQFAIEAQLVRHHAGEVRDLDVVTNRALSTGAISAHVIDAKRRGEVSKLGFHRS